MAVQRRPVVKREDNWELVEGRIMPPVDEITTDDVVSSIQSTYKQAEEELLIFVQEKISLMENNLLFKGEDVPTFYSLNKSLMDYPHVMYALIALHQEVRIQKDLAVEAYDQYYAEKYCEIKMAQVSLGKSAQFTSSKEIEMFVRKQYTQELAQLKANVIKAENKHNSINYLCDAWKSYQFVLSNLSKNAQAEADASKLDRKVVYDE